MYLQRYIMFFFFQTIRMLQFFNLSNFSDKKINIVVSLREGRVKRKKCTIFFLIIIQINKQIINKYGNFYTKPTFCKSILFFDVTLNSNNNNLTASYFIRKILIESLSIYDNNFKIFMEI